VAIFVKFSSLKMPAWWQAMWRKRYPGGRETVIEVYTPPGCYVIRCMGCGCGYKVFGPDGERRGGHCPTIRGAMRRVRKDAL
jgi:hypothetical protein